MSAEFTKSKTFSLATSVEYSENATVSKMVIRRDVGNITLFAFDKGQSLSTHSAPYDAFVQVIEGRGVIEIDKQPFELGAGECIVMPADVPHAVKAEERFKMMLVMIRGRE